MLTVLLKLDPLEESQVAKKLFSYFKKIESLKFDTKKTQPVNPEINSFKTLKIL